MTGKSHADNSQIVAEQKKQSDEAIKKEADRQARINKGLQGIKYAFEGKPVTAPTAHTFDWNTFQPVATKDKTGKAVAQGKLPAGFKYVQIDPKTGKTVAGTPAQAATAPGAVADPYAGTAGYGGSAGTVSLTPGKAAVAAGPAPASTGAVWGIQGPKGKIYKKGDVVNYSSNDPTGATTGGFNDAWFNDYNKKIVDYYTADINNQRDQAQAQDTYGLYRAGLGQSSAANTVTADLAKQYSDNVTAIENKADTAEAAKRADVETAKTKAQNQLYATENPDVAVNQALAAVENLSLGPELSPLAQLFDVASVGAANLIGARKNAGYIGDFQQGLPPHTGSGHVESS
jgi:hypothetical protein